MYPEMRVLLAFAAMPALALGPGPRDRLHEGWPSLRLLLEQMEAHRAGDR